MRASVVIVGSVSAVEALGSEGEVVEAVSIVSVSVRGCKGDDVEVGEICGGGKRLKRRNNLGSSDLARAIWRSIAAAIFADVEDESCEDGYR